MFYKSGLVPNKSIFAQISFYMVLSMTGFGQSTTQISNRSFTIEIKSLNGKSTDLRMRVPSWLKEKELELRKIILDSAVRGKIDASINLSGQQSDGEFSLNHAAVDGYLEQLKSIQTKHGLSNSDLIQSIMKIPNVVVAVEHDLSDEDWADLKSGTLTALSNLENFRKTEGVSLYEDLALRVNNIAAALEDVAPYESARIDNLRDRIQRNLKEFANNANVDQNRFEQEIIYYIEKLDINEEKVRLAQHCKYFNEILNDGNLKEKGKKLGFISQEIGREINTLGAKAQHSEIQKHVVAMKDNLEKIKEQVANIV